MKAGYKQTEVGVIPADWEVETIIGATRQIMDFRGRTPKKLNMDWGGGDIPALSAKNVKFGFIDFDEECYLGSEALYAKWMVHGGVEKGDVLFTTEAPLGNVALVPDERKYILSQRTVLFKVDQEKVTNEFLFHQLLSGHFQKFLSDNSSGSTAKGIQRKKLEQLQIAIPPLPEQSAIAVALSDVNELLASLKKLIAKKRDLKQATMQKLLTGKTRLPGFSGEWEVKRLDELSDIRSGGTPSTNIAKFWGGEIPWCTPTDITQLNGNKYLVRTFRTISREGLNSSSAELIPANSVVMTSRATIGECAINTAAITTNQGFKNLVPFESTDVDFLYYLLQMEKQGFIRLSAGSTFLEIGKTQLAAYEVCLPTTREEQAAIARVLSDMDVELEKLVARREKTQLLKQGMMQELLTGKARLV